MGITEKTRGKKVIGKLTALEGIETTELAEDVVQKATLALDATEIEALHTTPQVLVAAPGATKVVSVIEILAKYTFGTSAFTGSNALEFRYTSSNGTKVTADINASLLLTASGSAVRSVKGVVTDLLNVLNAPITVSVPTADPAGTGQTGTLDITCYYRTITP